MIGSSHQGVFRNGAAHGRQEREAGQKGLADRSGPSGVRQTATGVDSFCGRSTSTGAVPPGSARGCSAVLAGGMSQIIPVRTSQVNDRHGGLSSLDTRAADRRRTWGRSHHRRVFSCAVYVRLAKVRSVSTACLPVQQKEHGPHSPSPTTTIPARLSGPPRSNEAGRRRREVCENGDDALAALVDGPWDLLLTDIVMPGVDGIGGRQAAVGQPDVRIMFITGFAAVALSAAQSAPPGQGPVQARPPARDRRRGGADGRRAGPPGQNAALRPGGAKGISPPFRVPDA